GLCSDCFREGVAAFPVFFGTPASRPSGQVFIVSYFYFFVQVAYSLPFILPVFLITRRRSPSKIYSICALSRKANKMFKSLFRKAPPIKRSVGTLPSYTISRSYQRAISVIICSKGLPSKLNLPD